MAAASASTRTNHSHPFPLRSSALARARPVHERPVERGPARPDTPSERSAAAGPNAPEGPVAQLAAPTLLQQHELATLATGLIGERLHEAPQPYTPGATGTRAASLELDDPTG